MDARTSRYHEVYARSMRDPEGFWGEAAQAIDWYEPAKRVFDKDAGVYGRWFTGARLQHLLQRDRPPCGARAAATSPRSSTTRRSPTPSASSPMPSCSTRSRRSPRCCRTSASPRATASSSTCRWCRRRCSRCMPARASARSIRWCSAASRRRSSRPASTTAKPKLILSASCGIEAARVVAYKPLLDAAIDLAQGEAARPA